ncbi:dynamin family protein [Streptantibioticus ferralitis]|uniref:Dynamin family protein n=1 Tax=Streptantibioticus ferralitis TaxID=236510 RepID=A0ABT5Z5N9_9ACTN|nr:dynamin family protein [Streptantibioticus ferralitis]MDF2258856.1 dynamin family protein [Streptantibioticus ferralitis]
MSVEPVEPSELAFGNAVLDAFTAARDTFLDAVASGRKIARRCMPRNTGLLRRFDAAEQAVDACLLDLVIVGAEGAGKSTLVNALLGRDVTPQEDLVPGTVAPVVVEWGDTDQVRYSVVLDGVPSTEAACRDMEEFGGYVLSGRNEDNRKRVLRGYVRLQHPMLEKGVRLVDLPGVEGVSPHVAAELRAFLESDTHTVIGVCRDRSYGPLLRIAEQWSRTRVRFAAVVLNWSYDAWERNAARQEEWAGEVRSAARRVLGDETFAEVDPEQLFVLHLPTLTSPRSWRHRSGPRVTGRPHRKEAERFIRAVSAYMADNGADSLLFRAHGHALGALAELDDFLAFREATLRAVLSPDPAAARKLAAQVAAARRAAEDAWQAVSGPAMAGRLAASQWPACRSSVVKSQQDLLQRITRAEQKVLSEHNRIPKAVAEQTARGLANAAALHDDEVMTATQRALEPVLAFYRGHAQHALDLFFDRLPLLQESMGEFGVSPDTTDSTESPRLVDDTRARLGRGAGATVAGAAGGALAGYGAAAAGVTFSLAEIGPAVLGGLAGVGGGVSGTAVGGTAATVGAAGGIGGGIIAFAMTPVGALVLVAAGAGALGYAGLTLARAGSRKAFARGIEAMRTQVSGIDVRNGGPVHQAYSDQCEALAESAERMLAEKVEALVQLASPGGRGAEDLARELAGIVSARRAVAELDDRMTAALHRPDAA